MIRSKETAGVVLAAVLGSSSVSASEIGVAMAQGNVSVDQRKVPGSATLFHGSVVETFASPSTLLLPNSLRIDLAGGTAGVVYKDHLLLKDGTARASLKQGYSIETDAMIFSSSSAHVDTLVKRSRRGTDLSVKEGEVSVHSHDGVLLAKVGAGNSVRFEAQGSHDLPAATASPEQARRTGQAPGTATSTAQQKATRVQITGILHKTGTRFFLTDKATKITQELVGNIPDAVGRTITVVGTVKPGVSAVKPAERVVAVEQGRAIAGGFPCFGTGADDPERLIVRGTLRQVNGQKVITDQDSKVTSMLIGTVDESLVGKPVSVRALYSAQRAPDGVADQVVRVEESHGGAGGFMSVCEKAWIGGSVVTAAVGIGTAIAITRDAASVISQ